MAIVVEDGTILDGSPRPNSYVTISEVREFYLQLGDSRFSQSPETPTAAVIEASLIRAELYLRQKYRLLWKGSRVNANQALDWPREGVDVPDFFDPFYRNVHVPVSFQDTFFIPENSVPIEVKTAQLLLVGETMNSDGTGTTALQASLGRSTRREKVGDLEVEYFGAAESSDGGRLTTMYWDAMKVIEPFLLPESPHTGRVVRA